MWPEVSLQISYFQFIVTCNRWTVYWKYLNKIPVFDLQVIILKITVIINVNICLIFQESETGLFICLNTFLGWGKDYVLPYSQRTGNCVFLHLKRIKREVGDPLLPFSPHSNSIMSSSFSLVCQDHSIPCFTHLTSPQSTHLLLRPYQTSYAFLSSSHLLYDW